jgi:hypothetical protein
MRRLAALAVLALTACGDGNTGPSSMNVTLLLTDAPGDVESVWVNILHAYIRGEGEQIDLLDGPTGLIELTELAEAPTTLAAGVELPPGTYNELRFVIGEAVLETMDGDVFSKDGAELPESELEVTGFLHCPSCSQSGLKVKLPEQLALEDGGFVVMADFDVSQSFGKERGNSNRWVMHPVIHASALESGGGITGTVAPDTDVTLPECPAGTPHELDVFVPTATAQTLTDGDSNPVVRTGTTETDGTFAIDFLAPDTYTLWYEEEIEVADHVLSLTASVSQPEAAVTAGVTVDGVAYTITEVVCVPPA